MRKQIQFLITAVISIALVTGSAAKCPFTAYSAEIPQYVQIGLKYGSSAVASGTVSSSGSLILGTLSGDTFTQISDLDGASSIDFNCEGAVIKLKSADGGDVGEIPGDAVYLICSEKDKADGSVNLSGAGYRGGVILKPLGSGKAAVINYISLNDYLAGMLNAEMPQQSPIEALKAQAVAARNFAVVKQNTHMSDGFNLCAGTHCQVYAGMAGEYPRTTQAVQETEGVFMYSGNSIVEAYYSKNSGGYTNSSEDVWTGVLSYLRAKADPYSPDYPWNAVMSLADLKTKVESAGFTVGTIEQVKIKARSGAGSVIELEIKGSKGTALLSKEKIRTTLGATLIKSSKFGFGDAKIETGGSGNLVVAGANQRLETSADVYAINGSGTKTQVSLAEIYIFNGNVKSKMNISEGISLSGSDTADLSSGNITFTGVGYGHGVGMSQDGAIEMAKQGKSFIDILKFYYTGVEVR